MKNELKKPFIFLFNCLLFNRVAGVQEYPLMRSPGHTHQSLTPCGNVQSVINLICIYFRRTALTGMNDRTQCVLSHGLSQAVYLLTTTHLLNKTLIHNSASSCVAICREAPHCVSCWEMLTLQQHSLQPLSIWPLSYSGSKHCVCVCVWEMLPAADKPLRCESEYCREKTDRERERGDTSLWTFFCVRA